MSYIKFEHRHLGDDRWLDLSPAAFVVHAWALDYCNEQATDGQISTKMALRLTCPVNPVDLAAAWGELCAAGIWKSNDDGYSCPQFLAHGIGASEQNATRSKWAEDKRRQRLHKVGNHQLCSPAKCPGAFMSTGGQVDMSTSGKVDDPTRPDPTRPDQTPVGGSGRGSGGPVDEGARSAGATRDPRQEGDTRGSQVPPPPPEDPEQRLGRKRHQQGPDCCGLPAQHPIHQVAS